jgi:hypothetical protein
MINDDEHGLGYAALRAPQRHVTADRHLAGRNNVIDHGRNE